MHVQSVSTGLFCAFVKVTSRRVRFCFSSLFFSLFVEPSFLFLVPQGNTFVDNYELNINPPTPCLAWQAP
jgi:hypothetical protein